MVTRRPPFTGIHEIPEKRGDPGIHEGGGKLRPYGEDIFQRVVDVNWAGGLGGRFVSGDVCCYTRAAIIPSATLDQDWEPIGALHFGDGGTHQGCSYGLVNGTRPTFLMVGNSDSSFARPYGALVMRSHDGFKWEDSFYIPSARFDSIVWDGKRFYIEQNNSNCYSSADGYVWIQEPYNSFWNHVDGDYPDGIVGYNPSNGQIIFPHELYSDDFGCNCTAYMGGIWLAGGRGRVAGLNSTSVTWSSIDDGESWALVTYGPLTFPFDDPIVCIIGAPLNHFR